MTRVAPSLVGLVIALCACSPSSDPQAGSQTNWLVACTTADDCGGLECLCGACSAQCDSDDACGDLAGASCIPPADEGAVALCEGVPPAGLCLPRCDAPCPTGTTCASGVCVPAISAAPPDDTTPRIEVDTGVVHQTLTGFGASLSFSEDAMVANPQKEALYDFLFADSGLDVIRLRNRYVDLDTPDFTATSELIAAATERMGRKPLLLLTSGSPPAALKANGEIGCGGNADTCTLVTAPGGGFDYDGFAAFWRTSLEGYTAAGAAPDYVSIQNNPDWLPEAAAPLEACRFLPEEGTTTVDVGGAPTEVTYPGYREALAAVRAAVADLPAVPRFAAPEASRLGTLGAYPTVLDPGAFDALAIHVYDVDPAAVDVAALTAVRKMAQAVGRPVFQTEMQADGLATAVLVHHSVADADAVVYLQNDFAAVFDDMAGIALVHLTDTGFDPQGPYYALSHFAKHTDPGWARVEATSQFTDVLGTAWLAPARDALTVVLVNSGADAREVTVALPDALAAVLTTTDVTRTVFDGNERAAGLGALPAGGVVSLPAGSIATVAFTAE